MNSYEYRLGRFKYYARTAKGEDTFNYFDENSIAYSDWQSGYNDAYYEQRRSYLAMSFEELAIMFSIKDCDLLDGVDLKMKKDLNKTLHAKLPEKEKIKQKKI